jgi:hypothetical protein
VNRALASLLKSGTSGYTWSAATSSAESAASLELSSGKSVMAIGGFSGRDPSTTLARFERLVSEGKIHYYVAGGGSPGPGGAGGAAAFPGAGGPPPGVLSGGPPAGVVPGQPPQGGGFQGRGGPGGAGGNAVENQIQSWVSSHFKSTTVGGTKVYDLEQPTAS